MIYRYQNLNIKRIRNIIQYAVENGNLLAVVKQRKMAIIYAPAVLAILNEIERLERIINTHNYTQIEKEQWANAFMACEDYGFITNLIQAKLEKIAK